MIPIQPEEARELHLKYNRPFSFVFLPNNKFARLTIMGAWGNITVAKYICVKSIEDTEFTRIEFICCSYLN